MKASLQDLHARYGTPLSAQEEMELERRERVQREGERREALHFAAPKRDSKQLKPRSNAEGMKLVWCGMRFTRGRYPNDKLYVMKADAHVNRWPILEETNSYVGEETPRHYVPLQEHRKGSVRTVIVRGFALDRCHSEASEEE
ncbi:hypothetical protein LRS03_01100 [Rhizobacter sp. J219]|uniref:hypothetical protein n=1 Tax=Rhizobacter sp. J219 TaxID=2898430 RepID=UPI002150E850|nr:hypothetical protein [Rhizobacter sp. J219]MCR5881538.1 hypothetical protein [Rhizobacter sp. J219]